MSCHPSIPLKINVQGRSSLSAKGKEPITSGPPPLASTPSPMMSAGNPSPNVHTPLDKGQMDFMMARQYAGKPTEKWQNIDEPSKPPSHVPHQDCVNDNAMDIETGINP